MGDSDDEFEKRNVRDKFRHERNDYDQKDDRRAREPQKSAWARDRRDGRHSPPRQGLSPPQVKRLRRDWDEASYGHHYDGGYSAGHHAMQRPGWSSSGAEAAAHSAHKNQEADYPTQPPMMTLKQFLTSQDDNISEEEAIKRFAEYKLDFRKQQINEFFVQHKDEEWFRSKYHPDEFGKRKEEMKWSLRHRREVFQKMLALKVFEFVTLDMITSLPLIRMLDTAVILMEGGSEYDLKSLDEEYGPLQIATINIPSQVNQEKAESSSETNDVLENGEKKLDEVKEELPEEAKIELVKVEENIKTTKIEKEADDDNDENNDDGIDVKANDDENDEEEKDAVLDAEVDKVEKDVGEKELTDESVDTKPIVTNSVQPGEDKLINDAEEDKEKHEEAAKALHKTQSIFLRNLIPSITRQEVEAMCKKYPGFVRVSIQDPQPERRFARRGWITFTRQVNVKDICWSLNNIRLRDCDMGAIVNRELKQRVRAVNGLTVHRVVARQDIKHAARIIQHLDSRWAVWQDDDEEDGKEEEREFGFHSSNPILKNITDYLVDEGSYEDEILLGNGTGKDKDLTTDITIERDDALLKVLDQMLFYLRIVYSIDFYGAFEYPNEDEMPHRCGIVHARGQNTLTKITQADVNEWMFSFESKIKPFLHPKFELSEIEAVKLGKKNYDDEVEKFIVANMQELGKDKWLCPLSGKKFKGPEFVRKHILSKHGDKIEEVKKEVIYFNNYINDPRRLQLPEHPSARAPSMPHMPPPIMPGFLAPPPHMAFYRPPYPAMYAPPFPMRTAAEPYRSEFRGREREREREPTTLPVRRDRLRPDPRGIISYTDLDAPADVD